MKINKLIVFCLPVLFACNFNRTENSSSKDALPNIVFILADDLAYADIGSYGQKLIRTPYLDTMAANGMRFTQFYAGTSVWTLLITDYTHSKKGYLLFFKHRRRLLTSNLRASLISRFFDSTFLSANF